MGGRAFGSRSTPGPKAGGVFVEFLGVVCLFSMKKGTGGGIPTREEGLPLISLEGVGMVLCRRKHKDRCCLAGQHFSDAHSSHIMPLHCSLGKSNQGIERH